MTGADAEARCDAAGIVLNKNAIPYDPQPPSIASGIRVGTPGGHHAGHGRGRHEGDRRRSSAARCATPTAAATAEVAARRRATRRRPPAPTAAPQAHRADRAMREYAARPAHRGAGHLPAHARGAAAGDPAAGRWPAPRDRDVHAIPTPRLGGLAMFWRRAPRRCSSPPACPSLQRAFDDSRAYGRARRRRAHLPARRRSTTSGASTRSPSSPGRSLAAGVMVLLGVQLPFLVPAGRRHRHAVARPATSACR